MFQAFKSGGEAQNWGDMAPWPPREIVTDRNYSGEQKKVVKKLENVKVAVYRGQREIATDEVIVRNF